MTDPRPDSTSDTTSGTTADTAAAPTSDEAPRRPTYGQRRRDRIDALATAGSVDDEPGVSLIRSAWNRLRRNPVFLLGLAITIAFVVLAIIAPWLAPWDPTDRPLLPKVRPQSNPVPGPEPGHLLGGDDRGRDLLSRLIVG